VSVPPGVAGSQRDAWESRGHAPPSRAGSPCCSCSTMRPYPGIPCPSWRATACVKSEELHSRNDGSAPWRVAASPGERRTHLCYHHAAATTHVLPLHPRQPWLRGPALAGQAGVYDTTPSSPSVARWWWLGGGGPVHRHVNSQAEETRGQGDSCGCLAGPLQAPYHACWRRGFPDAPRNPNPRPSYLRV
jgi:hypothetical protein